MFYKLSKFSGRLVGSTQLKAMLPQGLKPFVEPDQITYDPGFKFASIPEQEMTLQGGRASFQYSYSPLRPALRANMIKFQKDDGVPVHLKGGTSDYVLLGITSVLIVFAFVESVRFIYESAFPKRAEC